MSSLYCRLLFVRNLPEIEAEWNRQQADKDVDELATHKDNFRLILFGIVGLS